MMNPSDTTTDLEQVLPPSKTKIKKQMHDLQDLGKQLTELPKDKWRALDLPEALLEALADYKRISETAPILAKLDAWNGTSREHTAWLHQVEQWRDRLLEDSAALTTLLAQYPQADAQRLRALIRNAQKEKELAKPPKAYREIFQLLREIIPAP